MNSYSNQPRHQRHTNLKDAQTVKKFCQLAKAFDALAFVGTQTTVKSKNHH